MGAGAEREGGRTVGSVEGIFGFGYGRQEESCAREDHCHKRSFVFFSHWNGNAAERHLEEIMELRNEATFILIEGGSGEGLEESWVA